MKYANIFHDSYAVGAQFGVILVPVPKDFGNDDGNHVVEVATFRSDIGYSDGRHPDQVRFTNIPREDAGRRDFTINGMMLEITEAGTLPDPITAGLK